MDKPISLRLRRGIKIGKNIYVRLAGDHLYGKLLFTWLSLVVSMMVSFLAVIFSDVLDEILNLIVSVSEGFPTYSHSLRFHLEIRKI